MDNAWFSITRTIGLAAFGVSLAACWLGWLKSRGGGAMARVWVVLAGVQFVLLLDMAFDWRWKVHGYWMGRAMASGVYEQRRGPQFVALWVIAGVVAGVCGWALFAMRRRAGVGLAVVGTALSAGLWMTEVISYHALDRVLYRTVGGAMVVSLVWCGFAGVTCAGVWLAGRSAGASGKV